MKMHTILPLMVLALIVGAVWFFGRSSRHPSDTDEGVMSVASWQRMAAPGELSKAHAFLGNNCIACHTPNKGVEASNCIVCHANDQTLLQRQPTAFHANVSSCVGCHTEHQGMDRRPTQMDHAKLATFGLRSLAEGKSDDAGTGIASWIAMHSTDTGLPLGHPMISAQEAALNCFTCHANQDRHQGLFGTDCVQCHTTTIWKIAEYRHPSPNSTDCVQCHQAPPSHYMMHFQMVSMKVAGQEHAQVGECFLCHQTTSWNDIKGVGWYKHH